MQNCFIGIDSGSISTKGVVIDENNKIIASVYLWTLGDPIDAVKNVITELKNNIDLNNILICGVGVTGSARNLIGVIIGASIVKNEITAHAIGTLSIYPDVKTIIEIGGQDSKLILLENGIVTDYAMNTLCAAGTGAFLSAQAKRLNIDIEDLGSIALQSTNPAKIAARCTVFAESDLVHKAQIGHTKQDIVAGICNAVASNYLNNLARGKKLNDVIVFQGGVSKNIAVLKAFESELNTKIFVDENGHLMGALGMAILSKKTNKDYTFNFNITQCNFKTVGSNCNGCSNNCEIISIYKNDQLLDVTGNRCDKIYKI
ncbi:MAG: acyl-CoA dehydratase activase [Clostridia bacterium]